MKKGEKIGRQKGEKIRRKEGEKIRRKQEEKMDEKRRADFMKARREDCKKARKEETLGRRIQVRKWRIVTESKTEGKRVKYIRKRKRRGYEKDNKKG